MKEWLLDDRRFALQRCADGRFGALHRGLRRHHPPPLGQTVVAELHPLIARGVIQSRPCVPSLRVRDHRRDAVERVRNPRDTAERVEIGGIRFGVPCGIRSQVPRGGGVLKGCDQRRSPLPEHRGIGAVAIPTLAYQGHPTVVRDHQFQDGLFHVGTVVFGVPMGDPHGLLVAVGDVLVAQGNACRVEMIAAQVDPFVGTNGQDQLTAQQITAVAINLIEPAAERKNERS